MQFRQLAIGTPPDIEATMTFEQAESLRDELEGNGFQEAPVFEILQSAMDGASDSVTFAIPGDEAGELGDFCNELSEYLEQVNKEAVEKLESEEA